MTSYTEMARESDDSDLETEIVAMYTEAVGILEGYVTDSIWNGHGTALCIRGMVFVHEGSNRWGFEGRSRWFHNFFAQAQFMMGALGERTTHPINQPEKRMTTTRALGSQHPLCCRGCGRRPGFTNLGKGENQWWVCSECNMPTEQWWSTQGDEVLNKFTDGPLDGMVYTSTSILNDPRLTHLLLGYTFTQEVVKSEKTGAIARVWLFSSTHHASVVQASTTPTESSTNGRGIMTAPESTETAPAAPAPESVNTSDLLKARNDLKLSRTQVSQAAGVTVAQLARIENGGKRTTEAEATQVRTALDKLRANQPAAVPAPPVEGEAAPDPA